MSPSTRSGRTYSEASSIASSRRSSTTGIAREEQAKSRKPARQQDSDHPPSKEVDPAKESRPDILEGCIADGVQEIHNKAVTTVRTGETTDKTYLNPTIREGQEETNHISGDTDVKPIETPSAVHSRPADNDPTTGAQLPSGTSLQDQSIPTVGRDGRRPTGGSRPERRSGSFDGYRTNEIYRQQYHMYETAKKANQHADATRALTECQRSYRNISKKLTWQFALSVNNGWNPFKEAKSAKLLAKLEGRSQPTASGSRPSGSYTSSSNQRGKRPAETDLNKLGKIPKLDTSWRETMAAARALQQARAQILEELRKEEEASKRRKKD
ncbi:hypothetical protein PGTUg99_035308 [Puccinia graminis f. sp. tritici]|uniref:Uncharacterized protein n=1 Tax=Puccinia graminis f. sp. tritici TaxID=56615 RepID=A0A5B0RMD5_PUCGR|nr:hypothetical protein PGTUg99_035308 [Puccinia graminis f. sp. tritici]